MQYDEPDYEGYPTRMISAPDFEKDLLPHDPTQCMECAIPLIKAHRMGASVSIESIDDSVTRSRSHTSDSVSSSTSSTAGATTKVGSRSNSSSRTGTEPPSTSRSPKSPHLTPKFKVGSVKTEETSDNGTVDSLERKSRSHDQSSDGEMNETHLQMNGTRSRSPSSSPLVRMKRIYRSNSEEVPNQATVKSSDNERVTESAELTADSNAAVDGYSPSPSPKPPGYGQGESRLEDQLSDDLSGQVESPTVNEDHSGTSSSSSGEVTTPDMTVTDRLEVKKDGDDVISSSSSSTGVREGGTNAGGDGASSSTQSSETKDVTAEVLINVVPSR